MAEMIPDFIVCHHCGKRFDLYDPSANDHWRECPHSPAREVVEDLLTACKAALAELGYFADLEHEAKVCQQLQEAIAKAKK